MRAVGASQTALLRAAYEQVSWATPLERGDNCYSCRLRGILSRQAHVTHEYIMRDAFEQNEGSD